MQNNNQAPYNGWIVSNSFLKRAFAIYGHSIVAALIIMIPFYIIFFLIFGTIFLSGLSNARDTGRREEMQNQQNTPDQQSGSNLDPQVKVTE